MYYNIRDSYKYYKKYTKNLINIKTYLLLANEYNKFLISKVLDGYEITLPSRLGTLSIVGKKQKIQFNEKNEIKGLAPDWVKTKLLWDNNINAKKEKKLIYHVNEHSSNIRYKFLWSKNRVLITNKTLYALRLTRTNKRTVNNLIVNEGKEYKLI